MRKTKKQQTWDSKRREWTAVGALAHLVKMAYPGEFRERHFDVYVNNYNKKPPEVGKRTLKGTYAKQIDAIFVFVGKVVAVEVRIGATNLERIERETLEKLEKWLELRKDLPSNLKREVWIIGRSLNKKPHRLKFFSFSDLLP